MRHAGKTPAFFGPDGRPLAGSIAEVAYHRLGGVAQWVLIRGVNVANPPLILLHGGPGMSDTTFFRHFNAVLEKSFTVVYWDQRGAGKSYDPHAPPSALTVDQLVADLDELVELVRARLGQPKVVLLGHSWGTALGVIYAARFPDKVAAYVGAAQIGDWPTTEAASYAYAVGEAQRAGDHKALEQLRAIGPPPYSADAVFNERMIVARLDGAMRPRELWKLGRAVLSVPESSIFEVPGAWRAFHASFAAMWPEVSRLNLIERVPALKMPVFMFVGRRDHWVPATTSIAYLDALAAPSKQLVWFEHSAHEAFVDEPDRFNRVMVELVRPAAAPRMMPPRPEAPSQTARA